MSTALQLRAIPIHRSLVRPILLGGAERELVILNMTFIAALIFGAGITKLTVISALAFLTIGQFSLVALGKNDPLMSRVYIRHIHYRDFYPAHASRLARVLPVYASVYKGNY